MSYRKAHFTLLELLVVLFILSLGIILTGVKIRDVYREQRFLSETQQVVNHLSMAQDLMLIMDADVRVHFSSPRGSKPIEMRIEVDKPLDPSWARLVERKLPLSAINKIEFDDSSSGDLVLQFSLGSMSKGKLLLYEEEQKGQKKKREFEINLPGYPSPIGDKKLKLKDERDQGKSEILYPTEVYEKLYQEPHEDDETV